MIGIGIRVAQDVGAHRRKYNTEDITVEDELWKRAFWYVPFFLRVVDITDYFNRVLVCIDRIASASFGRPSAIQDEEYAIFPQVNPTK
jgi:hypothetical protein